MGRGKEKPYQVEIRKGALKELQGLPVSSQRRVEGKISELTENPFPTGVKKLVGGKDIYRIRIGDYRIVYKVKAENHLGTIERIRHRKESYR